MRTYITDHWNGRLGFGLTLFVNLIGISFVVTSITTEAWPDWATIIGLITIVSLLVWQIVGGVRCANTLQKDQSGSSNAWGVYIGVFIAMSLVGFQTLDVIAQRYFIEPKFKTIFGNDDFTVNLKGQTVYLGGEVNYLMYQALLTILSQQEDVKAVSLDSPGGIVFAARSIAKLIEENKLLTRVERQCFSACTMVFAAGSPRKVSESADVGFHGYSLDMPYRFKTVDPVEEQEKDKLYLLGRGIDAEFLEHAFSTSSKTLWIPTHAELYQAGFTTEE
jgi:hypothetical protein